LKRPALVLLALLAPPAAAQAPEAALERARELATCAAYYFNATNVRPMAEYDRLYRAGESAFNRAARMLAREEIDRMVGDASSSMTQLTGADWRNFHRVEARYRERCDELTGFGRE
jgi:hypothetical protein